MPKGCGPAGRKPLPGTSRSRAGSFSMISKTSCRSFPTSRAANLGPMPLTRPDARYFSTPSGVSGCVVRRISPRNCWPCFGSMTQRPWASSHSPAETLSQRPDDGDGFPPAPDADPKDAEARLGGMERHALDASGQVVKGLPGHASHHTRCPDRGYGGDVGGSRSGGKRHHVVFGRSPMKGLGQAAVNMPV